MFFFFKQKTAYEMLRSLVGSEMCIRDRAMTVAMATPSTPIPSHVTDIISRTTFRTEENMRRYRGCLLYTSPSPRDS
ncbi:hypothetical protein BN3589_03088 [Clostridium sp. C105KSO14]|nr:hypothetical protein BN3589_03088 [Clostridium sp. C105KSO14]